MKQIIQYATLSLLLIATACNDMNDNIREYLDRGEINYIGKVDTVATFAGKGRIALVWHINNDPRIEYCTVYWNNRNDTAVYTVDRNRLKGNLLETDTASLLLPSDWMVQYIDLPEGVHTFEMYNNGSKGYRSMTTEARGTSYGEKFQSGLLLRNISEINAYRGGNIEINWEPLSPEYWIYTRLKYTSLSGEEKEITTFPGENRTILSDAQLGGKYSYTCHYLPEAYALDHFVLASEEMDLPGDMRLDKSLWQRKILPGDNDTQSTRGAWTNINNDVSGSDCWETYSGKLPMLFTIDLGATVQLSRYTLRHFDPAYRNHNLKNWKVYGSASPDFANTGDAYWTATGNDGWKNDWTLLAECYSFRPSGNSSALPTDEDLQYAAHGFSFDFPGNAPPVRYIRFHVENTWGGGKMLQVSELTFWAKNFE
jgi:hypothetical protein